MIKLKGQTELGNWVKFDITQVEGIAGDYIEVFLHHDYTVFVDPNTVKLADDPYRVVLNEIRSKIYDNLNEIDEYGNIQKHAMIFGSDVYEILDEMEAKL